VLLTLVLAACGGGGDTTTDDAAAPPPPRAQVTTTAPPAAATGPCGLKPMTFTNERWQGSTAPAAPGEGVLWEQTFTFLNPNSVDVRLTGLVAHLRLSGSGGYFLKFARTTFRPAPDEMVPAGRDQQRVAQVWMAPGNTPATEDVYAVTSAKVAGADCSVPVERLSTSPVPAHVLALPTCDPQQPTAPC
jgi:hypothetical protein